jgi:7-cyano-7-deazaguanine synthase in queuosine biosynthesis
VGAERLVICGDAASGKGVPDGALQLDLWGLKGDPNVTLKIADIHNRLSRNLVDAFEDLLEIATYVYAADQATSRGGVDVDTFGKQWRRGLVFHVPVRKPSFWNSPDVKRALCETLSFLSEDHYEFTFTAAKQAPQFQRYLELIEPEEACGRPEQVVLFSGGLDSLAGAIEEIVRQRRRTMLVTHRPTPKNSSRHRELQRLLAESASSVPPAHVAVRINKDKNLSREPSQRSRSFLFVALAGTVAHTLGLKNVRFYENGVVSLNLPVSAQVIGARATRTTHPRVLLGFQNLLSLVAGKDFTVGNPFLWKTKADVIQIIVNAGCGRMIAPSISCAHTWETTLQHPHCGTCSQCIDRRFGIIAANAEQFDPVQNYKVDIFTESRRTDEDKLMGAAFLERANQVQNLNDAGQLLKDFPQVAGALRYLGRDAATGADLILDLYRRHGKEVSAAAKVMLQRHTAEILARTLPGDCLLRTMYESAAIVSQPALQKVAQEAQPVKEQAAQYRYEKSGAVWEVVFEGRKRFHVPNGLGAKYIDYLLHHPNVTISAQELQTEVRDHSIARGQHSIMDESDPEAVRKYLRELDGLRGKRDQAVDEGQDTGGLDDEIEQLQKVLSKAGYSADAGERARGAVSKAIAALRTRLKRGSAAEKAFCAHLEQCVSTGYTLIYNPPQGDIWQ